MAVNRILGLDTSNYTTSAALMTICRGGYYPPASKKTGGKLKSYPPLQQAKKLLPVKPGELGLRQSDALFHHIKQLPEVLNELFGENSENSPKPQIDAIGVSVKPRNIDGSYMPCFLAGESFADSFAAILPVRVYKTSHQVGHILAALYSANRLELTKETFAAFHISGGTTDMLLCSPDDDLLIKCELISGSADLKAGQLIDRVGVMLGLSFPAGKELETLAASFTGHLPKIKISENERGYTFSGAQNICEKMLRDGANNGETPAKIAAYAINYVTEAIKLMIKNHLPEDIKTILFCGGVMSDKIIQNEIARNFSEYELLFTPPEYSCDNAAGAAIFAAIKSGGGFKF
jgi:N6-L-threonylcarbamoyladenine synthase